MVFQWSTDASVHGFISIVASTPLHGFVCSFTLLSDSIDPIPLWSIRHSAPTECRIAEILFSQGARRRLVFLHGNQPAFMIRGVHFISEGYWLHIGSHDIHFIYQIVEPPTWFPDRFCDLPWIRRKCPYSSTADCHELVSFVNEFSMQAFHGLALILPWPDDQTPLAKAKIFEWWDFCRVSKGCRHMLHDWSMTSSALGKRIGEREISSMSSNLTSIQSCNLVLSAWWLSSLSRYDQAVWVFLRLKRVYCPESQRLPVKLQFVPQFLLKIRDK